MKRTLILAATTILLLVLCSAVVIYSQEKPDYGPQAVFVVTQVEPGKMRVVPKAQIIFRIVPMPETHPAPLSAGTNMICRSHDVHATNGTFLGLKCGADEYIVEAVGITPEK
jgi:hypothetical protein